MKVGVDLSGLNPGYSGGVTTFSLGLAEGILHNLGSGENVFIFTSSKNDKFLRDFFKNSRATIVCIARPSVGRLVDRIITYISWLTRLQNLRYWYDKFFRADLARQVELHATALVVPTSLLNFYALKIPTILCIHDIQHVYHPENFTWHERVVRWAPYVLSASRATLIQVSSLYVEKCLLESFKSVNKEQIFFAPEGVDLKRFTKTSGIKRPMSLSADVGRWYILYPAQIWRHKNHILLMHALKLIKDQTGAEIDCVLTGADYGHWKTVDHVRNTLDLDRVFYLGRVEFDELLWLYRHCKAVLAVGMHESSSLPLREGALFGKPLVCADIDPNLELTNHLEAIVFDRTSAQSLATSILNLIKDYNDYSAKAEKNIIAVQKFEWNEIAKDYLKILSV